MKKLLALMMMLGLFVFVACNNDTVESEVEESEVEEEVEDEPTSSGDFTGFEQFLTLDMGLSIDEVTATLGEPVSTTMDLAGVASTTKM